MNLYIISDGVACKVGISRDVIKRLSDLQCGCSSRLDLLVCIPVGSRQDAHELETRIHEDYSAKCTMREWFKLSREDIADICHYVLCEVMPSGFVDRILARRQAQIEKAEKSTCPVVKVGAQESAIPAADGPKVERLLCGVDEVIEMLGVSRTSIWRLEKAGVLKPMPGMRSKRYSIKAIRAYAESSAVSN